MARQLSFVLFLLLATLSLVSALRLSVPSPYRRELNSALEEATHTNAQRLTQGLAPLKPRQLWDATRIRRTDTSSVPATPVIGQVEVYTADGTTRLGWLGPGIQYTIATVKPTTTFFKYIPVADAATPVYLLLGSTGSDTFSYATGASGSGLAPNSNAVAPIASTTSPTYSISSQSQIWAINPSSGVVVFVWTAESGQKFNPNLYKLYSTNLRLAGAAPSGGTQVMLKFVPS